MPLMLWFLSPKASIIKGGIHMENSFIKSESIHVLLCILSITE